MSLRKFLNVLLQQDDLMKIGPKYSYDTKYKIAAAIRVSCDTNGPAIIGTCETGQTVVGSVYGSERRIKRIFGDNYNDKYVKKPNIEIVKKYCNAADVKEKDSLFDYSQIIAENAPCQEVVKTGSNVDLNELPICIHNSLDKGRFITAGVNIVKWIDNRTHGLGIHRMNVIDNEKNLLSCLAPPNRRIGLPHYKASEKGKGIKMAVAIGAPPEVVLASQAKVNPRTEKYIIASKLSGKRIRLAKCITSDIFVPADSEIVLECTSIPNSQWNDTPFGEYPGTYSFRTNAWICRVDAITHRRNYIYQTILTGKVPQEDSYLCAIPYSAEIYRVASNLVEEVTDISVFLGNNVFDSIVCIKKTSNSEVENLIYQLLGNKYLKSITIMDSDLKATEQDWRFAFNTRYQPNRDTVITNLSLGASLDPSSPLFQSTSKVGFDFTIPIGNTKEETKRNKLRHSVANVKEEYVKPLQNTGLPFYKTKILPTELV